MTIRLRRGEYYRRYEPRIPAALKRQDDAVIDFGCSEHIFDIAQALRNVASLCKIGAQFYTQCPPMGFADMGSTDSRPSCFLAVTLVQMATLIPRFFSRTCAT